MKNKLKKAILLFIILLTTTFINDIYLRKIFIIYANELRLIDHFLAALIIPFIFYFIINNFYISCLMYIIWSTKWEIQQYIQRDYFQTNQYIVDLLGVILAILIFHFDIKTINSLFIKKGQN